MQIFRGIKLFLTDKPYYMQWKHFTKRQKAARNKLKKQAKNFSPWSGYYMHEMIKIMLEFYCETYLARDCCWSSDDRLVDISASLVKATHYSKALTEIERMEEDCLIDLAQKYTDFEEYVSVWEHKVGANISEYDNERLLRASLAEEFLTDKYTKAVYKTIGEHIWEWCD